MNPLNSLLRRWPGMLWTKTRRRVMLANSRMILIQLPRPLTPRLKLKRNFPNPTTLTTRNRMLQPLPLNQLLTMRSKTKRRSSKRSRSTQRNFKRRSNLDPTMPLNLRNLNQKRNQLPRKKMMKLQPHLPWRRRTRKTLVSTNMFWTRVPVGCSKSRM